MDHQITPERANEFTKELNALMDKYDLCFPSATWVYSKKGQEYPKLVANTELLVKLASVERYNHYFTLHYDFKEKSESTIS